LLRLHGPNHQPPRIPYVHFALQPGKLQLARSTLPADQPICRFSVQALHAAG
jgi:hypothetical protein